MNDKIIRTVKITNLPGGGENEVVELLPRPPIGYEYVIIGYSLSGLIYELRKENVLLKNEKM